MLIRLAIVAAAVIALAQPVWREPPVGRASRSGLARAVVVDRSPRMARPSDDRRPASERVAEEIGRLSHADDQRLIDAVHLRAGLAAAAGWAARQSGDREVVVVSSFPAGSLRANDVSALPEGVGLKLITIPLAPDPQPTGPPLE